ncbi:MAG TPA: hypothetical protein VFU68_02210 [Terracidiphilus sp.]|nr:hypothetical protein [Terracidiphilus sp.]
MPGIWAPGRPPPPLGHHDFGFTGPVHARDPRAHKDLGILHETHTVRFPKGDVVIPKLWQ